MARHGAYFWTINFRKYQLLVVQLYWSIIYVMTDRENSTSEEEPVLNNHACDCFVNFNSESLLSPC
jgi:hypothetical protein